MHLAAQSVSLVSIDTSAFPTMRAKFYAFDAQGNQQRPPAGELSITEDGVARTITTVTCSPPTPPPAISSVLVMDVSSSMSEGQAGTRNLDLAKAAARAWIQGLPTSTSECAVTSFDQASYLVQDFTTDRAALLRALDGLIPYGGTDYDVALQRPVAGGLLVSARGRYQRVIVMLTDGLAERPDVAGIVAEAKRQECAIYCVTLGLKAPQSLFDIAEQTGGEVFEDVTTIRQAEDVYRRIMQRVIGDAVCVVEWQSVPVCQADAFTLELTWKQARDTVLYAPPEARLAGLDFAPPFHRFSAPLIGTAITQTITVTARNAAMNVRDIQTSNPAFTITPTSFTLSKGESRSLTLRYVAPDSSDQFSEFTIDADVCTQAYHASGGYRGVKTSGGAGPGTQTLRITSPNGGEQFPVGSDTLITWQGVAATDSVQLSFSTNGGSSWQRLSSRATGLRYRWNDVPRPTSATCLVRVEQVDRAADTNARPTLTWQRAFGGSNDDQLFDVINIADRSVIAVGSTLSTDGDIRNGKGNSDMWVVKLDPTSGDTIWSRTFGGSGNDVGRAVVELDDGSILVVGTTSSADGDVSEHMGRNDAWLVNINPFTGAMRWQRCLGGSEDDDAHDVIQDADGRLVVVGSTYSNDGDLAASPQTRDTARRARDAWVLVFDPVTNQMVWQVTPGGTTDDVARGVTELPDGDYVWAGFSDEGRPNLSYDYVVARLSRSTGATQWQRMYGGSRQDVMRGVSVTEDGAVAVTGMTFSLDGDVRGFGSQENIWTIIVGPEDGRVKQRKVIGGTDRDEAKAVYSANDGTLLLAGYTASTEFAESKGLSDFFLVKYDAERDRILWDVRYGGSRDDVAYNIVEANDGSIYLVGETSSSGGDVTGHKGLRDGWIIKVTPPASLQIDVSDAVFSIVEPLAQSVDVDMRTCVVGTSKDSVVSGFVRNVGSYPVEVRHIAIVGADASAFSLVSGLPAYRIAAGAARSVEVRFRPTRLGLHQAQLVIVTQSDTLVQTIRGDGVAPAVAIQNAIIDLGRHFITTYKDTLRAAIISNVGTSPLTISSVRHGGPNDVDFTTIAGGNRRTLLPGDTLTMDLRFTPRSVGRTSGRLIIDHDGAASPSVVLLFGEGDDTLRTTIAVDTITATPGQQIGIGLFLAANGGRTVPDVVRKFTATLAVNPGVVHVMDPSLTCTQVDGSTCHYTVSGVRGNGDTVLRIPAIATLGTTDVAPIQLLAFRWLDAPIPTAAERHDGFIRIAGVCDSGGVRLYVPSDAGFSLASRPNPAGATVDLHFGLAGAGPVTIDVVDQTGRVLLSAVSETRLEAGAHTRSVDLSPLSNGPYMLMLRSGNKVLYSRMDVVR